MRRFGIGLLCALAVLGIAAGNASAISSHKAEKIALKKLKPKKLEGPVAVFEQPGKLGKGTVVGQAGVDGPMPESPVTLSGTTVKKKAYMFWLDADYGALFEHPSTLLLLAAKDGKVLVKKDFVWQPIVDGAYPPFLATVDAYHSRKFQIYTRSLVVKAPEGAARQRGAAAAERRRAPVIKPEAFTGDCMIMMSDTHDPLFKGNVPAMKGLADKLGLKNYFSDDKQALINDVNFVTERGCTDVFLYLTGHGVPPPGWRDPKTGKVHTGSPTPTVSLGKKLQMGADGKVTLEETRIDDGDIAQIISAHPDTHFKIKIDSCFAGRWAHLRDDFPKQVRVVEMSSKPDQTSKGYLKDMVIHKKHGKQTTKIKWPEIADNPTEATEFTNGNVHGLTLWSESSTQIAQNPGLGGAITAAFNLGAPFNGALRPPANSLAHADPMIAANPQALEISPIKAVFDESDRATTYSLPKVIDQPGRQITYKWQLSLQAVDPAEGVDPNCKNTRYGGFNGTAATFKWAHGNVGDPVHDDGCEHMVVGKYGHQGLITVTVTDDTGASCFATYKGTENSDYSDAGTNSVLIGAASKPDCTTG